MSNDNCHVPMIKIDFLLQYSYVFKHIGDENKENYQLSRRYLLALTYYQIIRTAPATNDKRKAGEKGMPNSW